jgi:hypothetical protein
MPSKTQQLQIRVTPQQKAALKRLARAAGCDLSSYVLSRLVPERTDRFAEILQALQKAVDHRYALAELNDFLHASPPRALADAVAHADLGDLSPYLRNYVAAMVEQASNAKQVAPPSWVRSVIPLESPRFATPMASLRMHLLQSAPVPFKRRNIFVDAGVGARI